jgi:succinyl-CoA synthetase beta subunit
VAIGCRSIPLTGLKAFVVANALTEIGAPKEIISPLVQQLPKLWELFHNFGMTTLELNPIPHARRRRQGRSRRWPATSSAASTATTRGGCALGLPQPPVRGRRLLRTSSRRSTSCARTQGQSDVYVINDKGTVLAPTFGGGPTRW